MHFGLARRPSIDLIEIHWPDGKIEGLKDAPINSFLTIQYGKGLVQTARPRSNGSGTGK